MKTLRLLLFAATIILLKFGNLGAQSCEYWSEPQPISDSLSDNRNATLVNIHGGDESYYVFWERSSEAQGSEIVYTDFYNQDTPQRVVSGNGFTVSNPQVVSVYNYPPSIDTLAYIFYQTNESGNQDIYYIIMNDTGFTAPAPFATSIEDETHLRVSPAGGMVWQEGDMIRFSRLYHNSMGFYFEPVVTIDSGDCRNPDIQNTDIYTIEEYLAWEKGSLESPEIRFSEWSFENEQWGEPITLFESGTHSGIRFSQGIDYSSWVAILLSDLKDELGQYHISGYDFLSQGEFISDFTQSESFQPDLLTVDFLTDDFWQTGYLSFVHEEGANNSDIYSSDNAELFPLLDNYCRIDSTDQMDMNSRLFQGAWHYSYYFDLISIWESWHNGHWQLFTSNTPVIIGSVPESATNVDLQVQAYPNPFNDFLWLEYESGKTSPVTVTIFNTFGQLVKKTEEKFSSSAKNLMKIETGNLPAGIYLVKTESGNSTGTIKVVKR